MSSTTGPKHLHYLMAMKGKRQRRGSLEAAGAQCLSLGMMCTATAYPNRVVVRGASTNFLLGTAWVLNHKDTPSHCPLLDCAGLTLVNLIALCCLLAILSSCGALLLDFLGLKEGRMAIVLLHGSAALFAASTAATSSGLWALTRHNLCAAQRLQPLSLSSAFSSSCCFCILACTLAAIATGSSCTALAQLEPAAALCLARIQQQETNPCPTDEQDGTSNAHSFPSSLQEETGLSKAPCTTFLQRQLNPRERIICPSSKKRLNPKQREVSTSSARKLTSKERKVFLPNKQIQAQMSQSLHIIQKTADSKMEEAYSFKTGKTT